jgi:hypothetical protein
VTPPVVSITVSREGHLVVTVDAVALRLPPEVAELLRRDLADQVRLQLGLYGRAPRP